MKDLFKMTLFAMALFLIVGVYALFIYGIAILIALLSEVIALIFFALAIPIGASFMAYILIALNDRGIFL